MGKNNERLLFPTVVYIVGFSLLKRSVIKKFLLGKKIYFTNNFKSIPAGSVIIVWSKYEVPFPEFYKKIIRVEDGFIRSLGLGVELTMPFSLVFDDIGIYFDQSQNSRFLNLIRDAEITEELRSRAKLIINSICEKKISKYNLSESTPYANTTTNHVRLVVGQVESDLAFISSKSIFKSNYELLIHVRKNFPDSFIIFKEHPDIASGIRANNYSRKEIANYCDLMILEGDPLDLLEKVDCVHTVSSSLGFEALIRGKLVYSYGDSFYSGMGLTIDSGDITIKRKRTIEELVVIALILYPRYYNYRLKSEVEVENIIDEIYSIRIGKFKAPFSIIRLLCCTFTRLMHNYLPFNHANK